MDPGPKWTAQRHQRKLERESASLVTPDPHLLHDGAKGRVAGCAFAAGVVAANHRPTLELAVRDALAFQPTESGESVPVLAPEPLLVAQRGDSFRGYRAHAGSIKVWVLSRVFPMR